MKLNKLNWRLLLLGEHCYLDTGDECYFMDEYECRQREGIKSQILALKRGNRAAIRAIATQLASALPAEWACHYAFTPMPPSSGTTKSLKRLLAELPLESRDLLRQRFDTPASHDGWRPSPEQREEFMVLNELAVDPKPAGIVVVDDVLATGSHFRAAKAIIRQRWPGMRVIGLFIARVCSRPRGHACFADTAVRGSGGACRLTQSRVVESLTHRAGTDQASAR